MKKEGKTCLRQGRNINYLKTRKRGHKWPKLKKIKMDFNSFCSAYSLLKIISVDCVNGFKL